jgi:hypothetical protein
VQRPFFFNSLYVMVKLGAREKLEVERKFQFGGSLDLEEWLFGVYENGEMRKYWRMWLDQLVFQLVAKGVECPIGGVWIHIKYIWTFGL